MRTRSEERDPFLRSWMQESGKKDAPEGLTQRIMRQVQQESMLERFARQPLIPSRTWVRFGLAFLVLLAALLTLSNGFGGSSYPWIERYSDIFVWTLNSIIPGTVSGGTGGILLSVFLSLGLLLVLDKFLGRRSKHFGEH